MSNNQASNGCGKGAWFRPVNKENYDRGYLRVFGQECPQCFGDGYDTDEFNNIVGTCEHCQGIGFVEKQ